MAKKVWHIDSVVKRLDCGQQKRTVFELSSGIDIDQSNPFLIVAQKESYLDTSSDFPPTRGAILPVLNLKDTRLSELLGQTEYAAYAKRI